jgi:hypothetical protein
MATPVAKEQYRIKCLESYTFKLMEKKIGRPEYYSAPTFVIAPFEEYVLADLYAWLEARSGLSYPSVILRRLSEQI